MAPIFSFFASANPRLYSLQGKNEIVFTCYTKMQLIQMVYAPKIVYKTMIGSLLPFYPLTIPNVSTCNSTGGKSFKPDRGPARPDRNVFRTALLNADGPDTT